jgi:lysophospholipase L1-like esterase
MPRVSQKYGFSLLAAVLAFGGLELLARGIEWMWPLAPARPMPMPGAVDCMPDCMPGVAVLPDPPQGLPRGIRMVPHGRRAWALPPNTEMVETNVAVRVNALALRGPDLGPKAQDELRILTLGDSSVFGFGVNEDKVFSSVAATVLADVWDRPVTGVIGGTPGYTSVQALDTLADVGREVQPDFVVIATLWSDLFQTETPLIRAQGLQHPSALYRTFTRLLASYLAAPTVGWIEGDVGAPGVGREARVGLQRFRQTVAELVRAAEALGALPVVMVLPAPIDLDSAAPPELIAAYRGVLAIVAQEGALPLVDGPAVFRKNSATNADFFDQVHPSVSGHRALGHALAAELIKRGPRR